jgi:hypothetical protein
MRGAMSVVRDNIDRGLGDPFPRHKLAVVRHRGSSRMLHDFCGFMSRIPALA